MFLPWHRVRQTFVHYSAKTKLAHLAANLVGNQIIMAARKHQSDQSNDREIRKTFLDCLTRSERVVKGKTPLSRSETKFHAADFFKHWFRDNGSNALFIFRKNLSVTNIQYAELFALIRANTSTTDGRPITNLQFSSVADFTNVVQELIDTFTSKESYRKHYQFVVDTYLPIFEKRVVAINFRGSCALFFPPGLKLDLATVCAHSGYVYSCGKSIYIRRVGKATDTEFLAAIKRYVKDIPPRRKVFFTIYAREDFKKYDPEYRESTSRGLDDLKIHLEKFYMNKVRLVTVVERIRQKFKAKLFIPNPSNFSEAHKKFREEKKALDPTKTLWLLVDARIGDFNDSDRAEKYYICYEQSFKNENQFQGFFDESKPAWTAPITIPHTLTSAMINIALPVEQMKIKMVDPFVGTGTTWFEASKYPFISARGSDNAKSTHLLVGDNLKFFRLSISDLINLETTVAEFCEAIDPKTNLYGRRQEQKDSVLSDSNQERFKWVRSTFFDCFRDQKSEDIQTFELSENDIQKLSSGELTNRFLFYLALRAFLKNIGAFYRSPFKDMVNPEEFWNRNVRPRYAKELQHFYYQIQHLAYLKERAEKAIERHDSYLVIPGRYSLATTINFERFDKLDTAKTIRQRNAEELDGKYHLVITDPPYGFNTDEDIEDLADLYKKFARTVLDSMTDNGQIIISLPEASHTGRRSPFFTHREIFIKQILATADDMKLELVVPARIIPNPKHLFGPPYYWEAERSLRRTILHFRVRCPSTSQRTAAARRETNQKTKRGVH
jgi:tRNA G10  N-methylase Trm11